MTPMEPRHDLTFSRRSAVGLFGFGVAGFLAGCGDDKQNIPATAATTGSTDAAAGGSAVATPSETGGPFPADGTNDNGNGQVANVLADARSVRSDIRSDLDGSNTQDGALLNLTVNVIDTSGNPLAGHAVYIWHCNKEGQYSEYDSPMLGGDFSARSFLRGAQVTDDSGNVSFTTILPGRYRGRAFHIHFEVFSDAAYTNKVLTSQMAMDDAVVDELYAAAGYTTALGNVTTNARDGVFSDGVEHQLLDVSGDPAAGLTATFTAVV